ncbi:MAG: HAMP domain-containing protein [Opitutus sp.]|nr:HAMP domain-containing protein [Opitutus sp.]
MENSPTSAPVSSERDWWWIFDPRISLRARAVMIYGGGAVLFTAAFSLIAGAAFRQASERQVGATFVTLAFQMSDKLDRVISQRQHELRLAASLAPYRATDVSPADRRRLLEAIQNEARDFAWIGFADPTGRLTAATRGVFEGTPVDTRPWFRSGRDRDYAGNLNDLPALAHELASTDDDRSTRFLDLAVPVTAVDGRFIGVLGSHLHWGWAREVQLSVVPEISRRERIGVTVYSATGEVLLDSGGSGWSQPPDAPTLADPRRPRGMMLENTSGGTAYVTGFARSRGYREYRGFGWLITVRQPAELVFAPARELQRRIAVWGFTFAFVLAIVSWVGAGRLARRLHSIGTAADRIRDGDILTVMPTRRGESEIATLCGSLGNMVDDFRQKQEALAAENARLRAQAPDRGSAQP